MPDELRDLTEKEDRFRRIWMQSAWGVVTAFIWLLFLLFSINEQGTYTVVAICALGIFALLAAKYDIGGWLRPNRATPWLLFLLCFFSRLAYCNFMEPRIVQVSDFQVYLDIANSGDFSSIAYHFFPHKAIYPFLLRLLGLRTQEKALFFQCIWISLIPPLLYRTGKKMCSEKLGVLAALLYLIWPAQFAYTAIVTEEHFVALLLLAGVSLILDVYHAFHGGGGSLSTPPYIKTICAGVLLAVSAPFRDYATIILIACALCGLVLFTQSKGVQRKRIVLVVLLLFGVKMTVQAGLSAAVGRATGLEMNESIIGAQAFWSMDPNGWGGWSQEGVAEYYAIAEKYNNDVEKTNEEAMRVLAERMKAGWYKLPDLLLRKGINSYSNDDILFEYPIAGAHAAYQVMLSGSFDVWKYIGHTFYLVIISCLLLCTLFRRRETFFILLITIGAILAQLPIECQGRYKSVIEPLWCLPTAWALRALAYKAREISQNWPEISRRLSVYRDVNVCKDTLQKWMSGRGYTVLCLSAMGIALGVLALGVNAYSCPDLYSGELLDFYFDSPFLLLMNLLPPFLLIWLGYFLFRRAWAAYLVSAVPTLVIALVNYYKIKLRGDPFYPSDVSLLRAAGGAAGWYNFPVTGTVLVAMACLIMGLLWCVFLCRRKGLKKIYQRGIGVLLCLVTARLFFIPYTSWELWSGIYYPGTLDHGNIAQDYIVRGGWYPFLYYAPNMFRIAPDGYDASQARGMYMQYHDTDIPEGKRVNVVGVMLEAFSDLSDFPTIASLTGVEEMYQPIHELEERSVRGDLLTDVFAGGTCIIEWASLTASNAYSSFLTDIRANEDSYVWYLRGQGYQTTYTHPNDGWMYNCQNVLPWLGFESTRFLGDSFATLVPGQGIIRSDNLLFALLKDDVSSLAAANNSAPNLIWASSTAKEALGKDFCGDGGDFSPCFLMQELFDACGWEGPGFMKLAREMREISPLISFHGTFLQNRQLTAVLSPDASEKYERYLFAQYYRKQHGLKEQYS